MPFKLAVMKIPADKSKIDVQYRKLYNRQYV